MATTKQGDIHISLFVLLVQVLSACSSREIGILERHDVSGCAFGSRWSGWIDRNSPEISKDGDREFMTEAKRDSFCSGGVISRVECYSGAMSYEYSKQEVTCNLETGLKCQHLNNAPNGCMNYKVRYYCQCPNKIESRLARSVHCPNWSSWYNDHKPTPTDRHDREIKTLSELDSFCSPSTGGVVAAVQCRDTKGETFTGTRDVVTYTASCELDTGLRCTPKAGHTCADFSVRYCCRTSPIINAISIQQQTTSTKGPNVDPNSSTLSSDVVTTILPTPGKYSLQQTNSDDIHTDISEALENDNSSLFCKKFFLCMTVLCVFIVLTLVHCCLTCKIYRTLSARNLDKSTKRTTVYPMDSKW